MIRYLVLASATLLLSACVAAPPSDIADCSNVYASHDVRIAGCSHAIESGSYAGMTLERTYNNRGAYYIEAKDYAAAEADFTAALAIDPNDTIALSNRPIAYRHLGKSDLALTDLNHAASIDPNDVSVLKNRALIHWDRSEYQLAADDFSKVVQLVPEDGMFLSRRAYMYVKLGKYDLAIADYTRTIGLGDHWRMVYAWRAETELRQKNPEAAWADFSAAIVANPHNTFALAGRCYAGAILQKDLKAAAADCDAAAPNPPGFYPHDLRGFLNFQMGKYSDAAAEYSQTLESDPKVAEALYGRGCAKMKIGDTKSAKTDIDAAVALDPKVKESFGVIFAGPPGATITDFRIDWRGID